MFEVKFLRFRDQRGVLGGGEESAEMAAAAAEGEDEESPGSVGGVKEGEADIAGAAGEEG